MRVLLVGSGGREDALALALRLSPLLERLFVAPGNAGIASVAEPLPVAAGNLEGLVAAAREHAIDLVVVGPEAPLVAGLADRLTQAGIAVFGPSAAAAAIEGSKAFMKDLCRQAGVPTADSATFTDPQAALAHLHGHRLPVVVKADGLAAGKGVVIAETLDQATAAARAMLSGEAFGQAGRRIVIEQFLSGREISHFALLDGTGGVLPLSTAMDHKRVGDGDTGPNTGGMGAVSPAPGVDVALEARILDQVVMPIDAALRAAGRPFRGVLFSGLMLGDDGVPRVLEFNARFGDPETQVILPRLAGDLLELLHATATGRLADTTPPSLTSRHAVGVVMAAVGYPGPIGAPTVIRHLPEGTEDSVIYHAATSFDEQGRLIAAGGRVLTVVGFGADYASAQAAAYAQVDRIDWPGGFCRRDIGHGALAWERARRSGGQRA